MHGQVAFFYKIQRAVSAPLANQLLAAGQGKQLQKIGNDFPLAGRYQPTHRIIVAIGLDGGQQPFELVTGEKVGTGIHGGLDPSILSMCCVFTSSIGAKSRRVLV